MSKASPLLHDPRTFTWPNDSYAFSPGLAEKIGLNEAVVLARVHVLLERKSHEFARLSEQERERYKTFKDGHLWVFNAIPVWHEHYFPFLGSAKTVERTFNKLRASGLLVAYGGYNARKGDKTLWYRIDYDKLSAYTEGITPARAPRKVPKVRSNDAGTGLVIDAAYASTPAPTPHTGTDASSTPSTPSTDTAAVQHEHTETDPAPDTADTDTPSAPSVPAYLSEEAREYVEIVNTPQMVAVCEYLDRQKIDPHSFFDVFEHPDVYTLPTEQAVQKIVGTLRAQGFAAVPPSLQEEICAAWEQLRKARQATWAGYFTKT